MIAETPVVHFVLSASTVLWSFGLVSLGSRRVIVWTLLIVGRVRRVARMRPPWVDISMADFAEGGCCSPPGQLIR